MLSRQYDDPETGLYYNCFRYYDPTTGRCLSPDPPLSSTPPPTPWRTWSTPTCGWTPKG
ncbi:RHS repeat-associated core domain-containing protein [Streptomyces sp. NPDC052644]